jgi:hypothetical protein
MTAKPRSEATPEAELESLIARLDSALQKLVRSVRAALRKRLPTANELVYDYPNALVVAYSANDRGIEGIVSFAARNTGMELHFNQGPKLPDPKKLLKGSGKMTRFIPVTSAARLSHPDVKALFAAAIEHASVPLPVKGKGKLIIKTNKAAAAKKKAGRARS